MNSHLNNQQTENQQEQQIFSSNATATATATTQPNSNSNPNLTTRDKQDEDQFRQVFFDSSNKRSSTASTTTTTSTASVVSSTCSTPINNNTTSTPTTTTSDIQSNKRARIDLEQEHDVSQILTPTPISPKTAISNIEPQTTSNTPSNIKKQGATNKMMMMMDGKNHHPNFSNIKRYRSRSLPNVLYSSLRRRHHHHHHHHQHQQQQQISTLSENVINAVPSMAINFPSHQPFLPPLPSTKSTPPPLPPVSLQSLREIDLHEILKNPQLRHDILFDPQLQFRPNLDGERGRKKKLAVDKYWDDLQNELESYIMDKKFDEKISRLPPLFQTLKEILISLLPTKDVEQVNETMDTDLLIQQLKNFSFDFVSLAKWLSKIFKSHCAPMRDSWVDEMTFKCISLEQENSISNLVDGLRMIFSILELMKLDVANHQIRILRPVLVETLVDFERNYFTQMVNRCKMNLQDSINWFVNNYQNCDSTSSIKLKELSTISILKLLSCRHMVTSFPTSLSFDHARLVLLRADIRQLVCLQLCVLLYKQMLFQYASQQGVKLAKIKPDSINKLKKEILAIVTDDNGNIKWTRNVGSIALQLSKLCINSTTTTTTTSNKKTPPESMVQFAFNWLIKQTQPSSQVYGLMEEKIFKQLMEFVNNTKDDEILKEEISTSTTTTTTTTSSTTISSSNSINITSKLESNEDSNDENYDLNQLGLRVAKLCNFHWSVFGKIYNEAISKL